MGKKVKGNRRWSL